MILDTLMSRAASGLDSLVGAALLYGRSRTSQRAEALGPADRVRALAEIAALYDRPEHLDPDGPFFPPPRAIDPRETAVRSIAGGRVVDWAWSSAFEPLVADVAERYLAREENRSAAARLYLHDGRPRPAMILLHGYRAGQYAVEERVWPIEWLFERGLDVAVAVLPFHAVRGRSGAPPFFPSSDPRVTIEGFRQAILDLRALSGALAARGSPAVGAMGMSLGGYTSSLLGTVHADLAFLIPVIPLASFPDVARDQRRLLGTPEEQRAQHEALERVFNVVSPFARKARLSPDRVLVIGASGDRITPIAHAERLAAHFQAPIERMTGGHLLQFGRAAAFREVGRTLGRLGLLEPRR